MTDDMREAPGWTRAADDPLREVTYLVLGCLGLVGVTAASAIAGGDRVPALVAELAVLVIAALGAGAVETTLLVAAAWGLLTGFVVNRYGELTFAPSDLAHLGLIAAAGCLAFATGRLARWLDAPAPRPSVAGHAAPSSASPMPGRPASVGGHPTVQGFAGGSAAQVRPTTSPLSSRTWTMGPAGGWRPTAPR